MTQVENFKILLWVAGALWAVALAIFGPTIHSAWVHRRDPAITPAKKLAYCLFALGAALTTEVVVLIVRINWRGKVPHWIDAATLDMLAIVPIVAAIIFIYMGWSFREGVQ